MPAPKYKRILLKLSGEALMGEDAFGINRQTIEQIVSEIAIKATKVDGVYTADPKTDPRATRYSRISFDEAIARNLKVMDATALTLCRDQKLPINVFSIFKKDALQRVIVGEDEGTLVHV